MDPTKLMRGMQGKERARECLIYKVRTYQLFQYFPSSILTTGQHRAYYCAPISNNHQYSYPARRRGHIATIRGKNAMSLLVSTSR